MLKTVKNNMYKNNKPNQYNKPKQKERFQLKEGKYFWMSSLFGTYTPEKEKQVKAQMEILNQKLNTENADIN